METQTLHLVEHSESPLVFIIFIILVSASASVTRLQETNCRTGGDFALCLMSVLGNTS